MLNYKKLLFVTLLTLGGLVSCGMNDDKSSPSISNSTSISTSSENVFDSTITEKEKMILTKLASGDFTKTSLTTSDSLNTRFEVKEDMKVVTYIYKGLAEADEYTTFDVYVAIDAKSKLISGIEYDGEITTHGKDDEFKDNDLGLIGTDGSEIDEVTGASVSSRAIQKVAEEAIAHLKVDA